MPSHGLNGLRSFTSASKMQCPSSEESIKYRLATNRNTNTVNENMKRDCSSVGKSMIGNGTANTDTDRSEPPFNASMLQMQIEVQRKLQEQLEVQTHLQLRIEAQGKYLQSVLRKAQETLAGYSFDSMGAEAAKAELSELVGAVDTEYLSSSFTTIEAQHGDCSTDSCLTSLERPEARDAKRRKLEASSSWNNQSEESDEIDPIRSRTMEVRSTTDQGNVGARSCTANSAGEMLLHQMGHGLRLQQEFDLNR